MAKWLLLFSIAFCSCSLRSRVASKHFYRQYCSTIISQDLALGTKTEQEVCTGPHYVIRVCTNMSKANEKCVGCNVTKEEWNRISIGDYAKCEEQ